MLLARELEVHLCAGAVVGILVVAIEGETEHRRKLPATLEVGHGVGATDIDGPAILADVGDAADFIVADRDEHRCVGAPGPEPVPGAILPAERAAQDRVADTGDRVVDGAAELDTTRTIGGTVRGHVHVAVGQHTGECQTSAEDCRVRDTRELGDVDQRLCIDVAHDAIAERGEFGSVRSQEEDVVRQVPARFRNKGGEWTALAEQVDPRAAVRRVGGRCVPHHDQGREARGLQSLQSHHLRPPQSCFDFRPSSVRAGPGRLSDEKRRQR